MNALAFIFGLAWGVAVAMIGIELRWSFLKSLAVLALSWPVLVLLFEAVTP